jgi:hypothetical protein
MSHSHEVKKLKNPDVKLDDQSVGSVTIVNIAGYPLSFGKPSVNLYPDDSAIACEDHPSIQALVAKNLVKVLDGTESKQKSTAKPKIQKAEEPKVEETFETVAEVEPLPSVQLTSSSNDETLNSEEL